MTADEPSFYSPSYCCAQRSTDLGPAFGLIRAPERGWAHGDCKVASHANGLSVKGMFRKHKEVLHRLRHPIFHPHLPEPPPPPRPARTLGLGVCI